MSGVASASALLLAAILVLGWRGQADLSSLDSARFLRPRLASCVSAGAVSSPSPSWRWLSPWWPLRVRAVSLRSSPCAAMTAVLALALRRGADAGCGCFGGSAREPISVVDLMRNAALLVAAAAALGTTRHRPRPAVAPLLVAGCAAMVAVGLGFAQLHRRTGRLWSNDLSEVGQAARWAAKRSRETCRSSHDEVIDLTGATTSASSGGTR